MSDSSSRRGLFRLLADLPRELSDLVRAEIRLLQTEFAEKLRHAGVGLGLVSVGAVLVSLFVTMLMVALILGLSVFMAPWAAALVVAAVILVAAVVLFAAGIASIKKGFTPFESVDTIAADFKNLGKDNDERA